MTAVTHGPFGPITIDAADLELLESFTGLGRDACLGRLARTSLSDMAEDWRRAAPSSSADIRGFYSATHEYVWELLAWNLSTAYRPYRSLVARIAAARPQRVLDHGAGIGTAALELAERGIGVTIADVPGPTLEFAKQRLRHRGVDFDVLEVTEDVPDFGSGSYDAVLSFDVLEHVVRPREVVASLRRALRPGAVAAITASFDQRDDDFPHHLPQHVERYGAHRWEMHLRGIGFVPRGEGLYRRVDGPRRALERLRYVAWRATGLHVERRPA